MVTVFTMLILTCSSCFSNFFSSFRWISLKRSTCFPSGELISVFELLFKSASMRFSTGRSSSPSLPMAWSSVIPAQMTELLSKNTHMSVCWRISKLMYTSYNITKCAALLIPKCNTGHNFSCSIHFPKIHPNFPLLPPSSQTEINWCMEKFCIQHSLAIYSEKLAVLINTNELLTSDTKR